MLDIIAALVTYLKGRTAISNLVGTRVFGAELPQAESASMPRKALVIRHSGGPSTFDVVDLSLVRFDFFSYGETPFEAGTLQRAVHNELKFIERVKQTPVLLHWVNTSGGPISLKDPDTQWPVVLESWLVLASDTSVI